jgi:polyisoprenoid-binding protein YceI
MKFRFVVVWILITAASAAAADGPCIVPGRGHFQIRTGTSGLFGVFGHDHLIEAQKIEGCAVVDGADPRRSSIKLTFTAADIRVTDPKESASERAKVQETMDKDVLAVTDHPRILFESTAIERSGAADTFRVRGNLTIRGKTQSVVVPVTLTRLEDGTYRATGRYEFKQTSFGIRPIQLAGGTVKVKDEVRTEFELYLK